MGVVGKCVVGGHRWVFWRGGGWNPPLIDGTVGGVVVHKGVDDFGEWEAAGELADLPLDGGWVLVGIVHLTLHP